MNILHVSASFELKLCGPTGLDQNTAPYLCKVHQNYSKLDFPLPTPFSIQIDLRIQEIIEINEKHQLINIILKLVMRWNDTRVSYAFNENNKGR